jgi:spore maturation protein CgeB
MRLVLFCHSLISDWNHGNAHFLRGIAVELLTRGHDVRVYEPRDSWSVANMLRDGGEPAIGGFHRAYPMLAPIRYEDAATLDLDEALDEADVVLVHEWNDPALVARVGHHRAGAGRYVLFFHDTHHRSVSDPNAIRAFDLSAYDGVLAFGAVIRDRYVAWGWGRRAWTWHEAADVRMFHPLAGVERAHDLVWIGNWGDGERSAEIREYLVEPVRDLKLSAQVFGVRYPEHAIRELREAGIAYGGWLPNYRAAEIFAQHRVTVHIPRRPYVESLPGIPTIRVFEALACGIPLVSAYWRDTEQLFTPGRDYLVARSPGEMRSLLHEMIEDRELAQAVAAYGLETIRKRHTCAHRVDELLQIVSGVRGTDVQRELTV